MALVFGTIGNDFYQGTQTQDVLVGSSGNDIFNGLNGFDIVDYGNLGTPITLLPRGVISKGLLGQDRINGIEGIIGSRSANNLIDISSGSSTSMSVDLLQESLNISGVPFIGSLSFRVRNFNQVTGGFRADRILGDNSRNILSGNGGNDSILGRGGNDILVGGSGADFLSGQSGNDRLVGGSGNDILIGGSGRDILIDGGGRDLFRYDSVLDSRAGSGRDIIRSLNSGLDRISLARIDADLNRAGNQAFRFIGTRSFTGRAGEVRYFTAGNSAIVQIDRQGDRNISAEMELQLVGSRTVRATDFIL
jgi:Ca2+-binding RTX toxin-like protein